MADHSEGRVADGTAAARMLGALLFAYGLLIAYDSNVFPFRQVIGHLLRGDGPAAVSAREMF